MRDEAIASTASEKFVVRLPKGMRRAISEAAGRNRRSMNSEIVAMIDRALGDLLMNNRSTPASTQAMSVSVIEQTFLLRLRAMSESKRRALLELLD